MKLLITTPYLKGIGGTEIETLNTAQELAAAGKFSQILIFCPSKIELASLKGIVTKKNISFYSYPEYFENRYVKKINAFLRRKLNSKISPIETLYWFLMGLRDIDYVYILSSTNQIYYIPILKNFKLKNCLIKYTIVYDENLANWKKKYLRLLKCNIVMSTRHQGLLNNILKSNNTIVRDAMITNEQSLLNSITTRQYTFGILCRFSKEKRIEDAILLINDLNLRGINASLIIQGDGDQNYFVHLKELIKKYDLQDHVTLFNENISPINSHLFYNKISFFLITSEFETGPLTGLESMAAGVPVLSYNVGAMKERMVGYEFLIAKNFEDLVKIAIGLNQLNIEEYDKLSGSIRQSYIINNSNSLKVKELENLFFLT